MLGLRAVCAAIVALRNAAADSAAKAAIGTGYFVSAFNVSRPDGRA